MAYSYCRSASLSTEMIDNKDINKDINININGIHEGNMFQLYKEDKPINLQPFRTSSYYLTLIWRAVQENETFYLETFPVECRECQNVNKEGIWVETYFFCKPCSGKIWNYIRAMID